MSASRFSRIALPRLAGTRVRGAASVAGPATRRLLLSEVPPEEHASAFLEPGVIGDGPKPALALVTKCLELRHQVTGANSEDLERYGNDDAVLLIAVDEADLLKIRQQHLANPCR
jgi:hypothetical protein